MLAAPPSPTCWDCWASLPRKAGNCCISRLCLAVLSAQLSFQATALPEQQQDMILCADCPCLRASEHSYVLLLLLERVLGQSSNPSL